MQDEYLTRCVVDTNKKTFRIYSSEGSEKEVICDTVDEFINVLNFVRSTVDESILSYTESISLDKDPEIKISF